MDHYTIYFELAPQQPGSQPGFVSVLDGLSDLNDAIEAAKADSRSKRTDIVKIVVKQERGNDIVAAATLVKNASGQWVKGDA